MDRAEQIKVEKGSRVLKGGGWGFLGREEKGMIGTRIL